MVVLAQHFQFHGSCRLKISSKSFSCCRKIFVHLRQVSMTTTNSYTYSPSVCVFVTASHPQHRTLIVDTNRSKCHSWHSLISAQQGSTHESWRAELNQSQVLSCSLSNNFEFQLSIGSRHLCGHVFVWKRSSLRLVYAVGRLVVIIKWPIDLYQISN